MSEMKKTRISKKTRPTHTVPSGLGGRFDCIIKEGGEEKSTIVVVGHADGWHGYTFTALNSDIKEI